MLPCEGWKHAIKHRDSSDRGLVIRVGENILTVLITCILAQNNFNNYDFWKFFSRYSMWGLYYESLDTWDAR
jgi:low temperature requirement protein LtrA